MCCLLPRAEDRRSYREATALLLMALTTRPTTRPDARSMPGYFGLWLMTVRLGEASGRPLGRRGHVVGVGDDDVPQRSRSNAGKGTSRSLTSLKHALVHITRPLGLVLPLCLLSYHFSGLLVPSTWPGTGRRGREDPSTRLSLHPCSCLSSGHH
jgi:hypothetical protein